MQLKLTMGNIEDQKQAIEALKNVKTTWEDLLNEAKVQDRDAALEYEELYDSNSPVTALILYIYQVSSPKIPFPSLHLTSPNFLPPLNFISSISHFES